MPAFSNLNTARMSNLSHRESIIVDCSAEDLYDMVSDATRIGEWSPVCKVSRWGEGNTARVGDWFTGRNVLPERTWETRSEVFVADTVREFALVVGDHACAGDMLLMPLAKARESRIRGSSCPKALHCSRGSSAQMLRHRSSFAPQLHTSASPRPSPRSSGPRNAYELGLSTDAIDRR